MLTIVRIGMAGVGMNVMHDKIMVLIQLKTGLINLWVEPFMF
jgi:hypothetical protein